MPKGAWKKQDIAVWTMNACLLFWDDGKTLKKDGNLFFKIKKRGQPFKGIEERVGGSYQ